MNDFQKIGDVLKSNPLVKKWTPPEKVKMVCVYCQREKDAIKEEYDLNNNGTLEKRFSYRYVCPNRCAEKRKQLEEHIKRYKKAKEVWKKAGFTREGVGWTLDKMTCENIEFLRDYAKKFNRFSKALVLQGYQGTGKTLSSECIAKELTHKGKKVRITNMSEINLELNQALRKDNYKEYMNELLRLDLIIIDDFGREQYTTEKSLENVFQFFNTLVKERKPFIVSTNPEMLAIIAEKPQLSACLDRFRNTERVTVLKFTGKSFRR